MEENTKNTKNTKKIVLGVVLFAVVIAVLFGCWKVFGAKTTQGAKSYTLTVQDDQGDKKVYEGYTDAEYVRGALEELEKTEDFTLEGSESDYGLYIEKVNGLEADYNKDGAYWALYMNGEYAQNGIDTQPVRNKDEITLSYEKNAAESFFLLIDSTRCRLHRNDDRNFRSGKTIPVIYPECGTGYIPFDTLYLSIWQKSALCSFCLCRCGMSDLGNGNMGHHVFIHLALALRIDTIFKKTKISMVLGSFFRHLWSDVWRIVQSGIFGIWWNKDGICMVDCRNPL